MFSQVAMVTVCERPSQLLLLESAFRSFAGVLATQILAGEVDTDFSGVSFSAKLSWLVRFFNPVNLCWRYYSMLAFRFTCKSWGDRQLALMNFEAYPYKPPVPYIVGESLEHLWIRRLEVSGLVSSQGLLGVILAYQGITAVQFSISTHVVGYLGTISKPLAIIGLFRVMVSSWVASKVFIDPYPYPQLGEQDSVAYTSNKLIACGWAFAWFSLVMLSTWPYIGFRKMGNLQRGYVDLSMDILYQYITISVFLFHIVLLMHGSRALANRILYFDHWLYRLQTLGFLVLLFGTLGAGLFDFISHDFYRSCT